jgi:hypothetical protein
VATYKVHQVMDMKGKRMEMHAFDSSTWIRIGGEWRCIAHTESLEAPKST